MKLIELLTVILIISILAALLAGPTTKAYWNCKRIVTYVTLKHNGDIEKAINGDFSFLYITVSFKNPITDLKTGQVY